MSDVRKIIIQPTALAEWYTLISDAQMRCRCRVHEDLESYLVYLLLRFSTRVKLAESVLGLDFLQAVQLKRAAGAEALQEVGDKSLLFSGLFPDIAKKRHVSLSYFVDLGQVSYWQAGNLELSQMSDLFYALCREFASLQAILQATRQDDVTARFKDVVVLNDGSTSKQPQ